jgi:hypothetical protein
MEQAFRSDLVKYATWPNFITKLILTFLERVDFPTAFKTNFPAVTNFLEEHEARRRQRRATTLFDNDVITDAITGLRISRLRVQFDNLEANLKRHVRSKMRRLIRYVASGDYIQPDDRYGLEALTEYDEDPEKLFIVAGSFLMELSILFNCLRADTKLTQRKIVLYVGDAHAIHLRGIIKLLFWDYGYVHKYHETLATTQAEQGGDRCVSTRNHEVV